MTIQDILNEYDHMFGNYSLLEIEDYLIEHLNQAKEVKSLDIVLTLLNETIGFFRDTTQKDKALFYCHELLNILKEMNLEGTIEYATSLLNIANAYRAFGLFNESLEFYNQVNIIYQEQLDSNDFRFASLYNNWSLVYQEIKDYSSAQSLLLKALDIVDSYDEAFIQQATTRVNLATSLIQMNNDQAYQKAIPYLKEALDIFEKDGCRDFHYGAALVTIGDACYYKKDYLNALKYYASGLKEIEKHTGKNDNYQRVLEKYNHVHSLKDNDLLIKKSQDFYEQYGQEMIHTYFKDYENRIAVGVVGEGSDCFGFDDDISSDHDYDIGFCMWLIDDDYQKIGDLLQEKYEQLIKSHIQSNNNQLFKQRRGVFSINQFYNNLFNTFIHYEKAYQLDYENIEEYRLANGVNGKVFKDELGIFSSIRQHLLDYYPDSIYRKKLASELHEFSQYAQSNYPRMMARKDIISANLCKIKAIESVMNIIYLLCKKYAPYYKWKRKGLENEELFQSIEPLLKDVIELDNQKSAWNNYLYDATVINTNDQCVVLFEKIASLILEELKKQKMVKGENPFLELYIEQILKGVKGELVDKVIALEWEQFDQVDNMGGRADCQDDFATFSIMRKSQYLTWDEELLESFHNDLLLAKERGWNLITEKYARMMKSTAPKEYALLEKTLPVLSEDRIQIQEEIIKIQVNWMEEFSSLYPKLAGHARSIRTSEDSLYNTSYETYLRGEISTYSKETLILYGNMIARLLNEGKNLTFEIMENTVKLYGYQTLEDAESDL